MRRVPISIVGVCLIGCLVRLPGARGENCGVCHGEQETAFRKGIHEAYHLYCVDCHGGDSKLDPKTLTGPKRTGACKDHPSFRGKIEATRLTDLCGSCHSDVEKMRPFRIPTDQLAHYRNSLHGKALYEKGDPNTATCVSCHGSHEIRRVKDPRSKAHRRNVPGTCASCHADEALMARYEHQSDPWEKYASSVHGEGLLKRKLPGVPTCADCHGVHGAAPPGVEQVENMCGYCHTSTRKAFDAGPHRAVAEEGEMKACVSCHGAHGVQSPDTSWFLLEDERGCFQCHDDEDTGGKAAREIHDGILALERRIRETRKVVLEAREVGLFVEDERGYLDEARRILVGLEPATHSASVEELREFLTRGEGVIEMTRESVRAKHRQWRDRRIGAVIASASLLLLAGLLLLSHGLHRRYRRSASARNP